MIKEEEREETNKENKKKIFQYANLTHWVGIEGVMGCFSVCVGLM